jgi:hypothetical protein
MPGLTEHIETSQAAEKPNYRVEHVRQHDARGWFAGDHNWQHLAGAKEILDEYVARIANMNKRDPRRTQ